MTKVKNDTETLGVKYLVWSNPVPLVRGGSGGVAAAGIVWRAPRSSHRGVGGAGDGLVSDNPPRDSL